MRTPPEKDRNISDRDLEREKFQFEKEKWQFDTVQREREIRLKEDEQHRSSWTSPLVIAIFTAALAAAGNIILAFVNGELQRAAENDRAGVTQQLEKRKAESNLILEMIKTNNADKAAENLKFLADSGLLTDKQQIDHIHEYLDKRKPGQGPALPVVGGDRVVFDTTNPLPPERQATLRDQLTRYSSYLEGVGFSNLQKAVRFVVLSDNNIDPTLPPEIRAQVLAIKERWISFYLQGFLFIRRDYVDYTYYPLRDYTHHALFQAIGDSVEMTPVESALADYFPGSFLTLVADTLPGPADSDLAFLENDKPKTKVDANANSTVSIINEGRAWAASFWECRGKLSRAVVDSLSTRVG